MGPTDHDAEQRRQYNRNAQRQLLPWIIGVPLAFVAAFLVYDQVSKALAPQYDPPSCVYSSDCSDPEQIFLGVVRTEYQDGEINLVDEYRTVSDEDLLRRGYELCPTVARFDDDVDGSIEMAMYSANHDIDTTLLVGASTLCEQSP